ncbi:hypothetical protein DENSPDRAFT_552806 [Dentipellis sp. KUC8613]|nr:hypothetical protein DENSPDRAFT_552806 [Dentipellis sp. KUC8613]
MQATLDAVALKPFTRALTCLSKYGDDLTIYATPDALSLSATNTSLSAYSRFRYSRAFFVKYSVGAQAPRTGLFADDVAGADVQTVTGQLLTKSLLSILKHRTVEKTVDRCDLFVVEGAAGEEDDEDRDSLESRLVVRLHCKHGIVKTHRLLLLTPTSLMAPGVPDDPNESRLTIGPQAVKDMLDHFPSGRSTRTDPQLIWAFDDSEVQVRSLETSADSRGSAQLSTELTISADEFDTYDVFDPPVSIAFHLREFNATIAYADSMSLSLDLRFTDPAAPLFIDVEGDSIESLFVVSTSHAPGANANANNANSRSNPSAAASRSASASASVSASQQSRKRTRDGDGNEGMSERRAQVRGNGSGKKVVARTDAAALARRDAGMARGTQGSMAPPPSVPRSLRPYSQVSNGARDQVSNGHGTQDQERGQEREPLFLPASQMSVADEAALAASGLGVEGMDAEEFHAMMEDEGMEL